MKRPILNLTQWISKPQAFLLGGILLLLLSAGPTSAQGGGAYELSRWTIAGGGGNSVGGDYQLTGGISQLGPNSIISGGEYTIIGGFWPAPMSNNSNNNEGDRTIYLPVILRDE